jgi:hypothetical protein
MTVGIGAIKQSDVEAELGIGASHLSTCFSYALDSEFDPTYKGNKDRLGDFQDYTYTDFNISPSWQYYSYWGSNCGTGYFTITTHHNWYAQVDTSEITGAYVSPSSGSPGVTNMYFYPNSYNWDSYDHTAQIDIYDTDYSSWLGTVGGGYQYRYGQGC